MPKPAASRILYITTYALVLYVNDWSTLGISERTLIKSCENINPNTTYERTPNAKGINLPFHLLITNTRRTIRTDITSIAPADIILTVALLPVLS